MQVGVFTPFANGFFFAVFVDGVCVLVKSDDVTSILKKIKWVWLNEGGQGESGFAPDVPA